MINNLLSNIFNILETNQTSKHKLQNFSVPILSYNTLGILYCTMCIL